MTSLRSSTFRVWIGLGLLVAAAGVALFFLPDAAGKQTKQAKAASQAREELKNQIEALAKLQHLADRVQQGQVRIGTVLEGLPQEGAGALTMALSRTLHDLAKKHSVRLQSVKYGTPTREGAKGTDLEALDVEFTALGVYATLKPFMLALEGSPLPFGLVSSKLEESPDGGRLTVRLRGFRRTGVVQGEPGEGA